MKSFKQYITEARPNLVKGWVHKSGKIAYVTTDYSIWHIKQVVKFPSKFGLSKNKILKILADAGDSMSAPEDYAEEQYNDLISGKVDNDVYIEEYLFKKGYCMFLIDKTHGKVEGWDVASTRSAAKAIDDKYLPFERNGFKLFEIKTVRGADKYHTNKLDWYDWVGGKKKRNYVSPMAQFRESKQVEFVLWGVPPGAKEETLVLDAPGGKPITKLSTAKKYKAVLEKEHGVTKIRIQTIDFSQDLSKMFTNKNLVR